MDKRVKREIGNGRGAGEILEHTEGRFRQWRASRHRGARIPLALWAAAVALAERYGVERIAQQLRVDEQRLRKHVQRAGGVTMAGTEGPRFVELLAGSPSASIPGLAECVVEMENARGGKLRVQLRGGDLAGLAALTSGFWGGV